MSAIFLVAISFLISVLYQIRQSHRTSKIRHKVNFFTEFNRFALRVLLLLDQLPYQIKRTQSALLFTLYWKKDSWMNTFPKGISKQSRPGFELRSPCSLLTISFIEISYEEERPHYIFFYHIISHWYILPSNEGLNIIIMPKTKLNHMITIGCLLL